MVFRHIIYRIDRIMSIEELCYKVIGVAMAVHRHFGPGYLEEVYKNALMIELDELGIRQRKKLLSLLTTRAHESVTTERMSLSINV